MRQTDCMTNPTDWHRVLKDARVRAGLTQEQIAEAIGRSQPTVLAIEKGKTQTIAIDQAEKWLRACGSSIRVGTVAGDIQGLEPDDAELVARLIAAIRAGLHPEHLRTLHLLLEGWPVGQRSDAQLLAAEVNRVLQEYGLK